MENSNDSISEKNKKYTNQVDKAVQRRIKAEKEKDKNIWFGMGMFGIVGWSVTMPTLMGTALGVWIDNKWLSPYSWTLMLLFLGLIIGCLNAWFWIQQSSKDE